MNTEPPPRQTPADLFGSPPPTDSPREPATERPDRPAHAPSIDHEPPGALVSIHAAALHANAESFPVLKAFQDYLEAERQRARKRMFMLSAVFLSTLLIVIVGMLVAGLALFRHFAQNTRQMQNVLVDVALRQPPLADASREAANRATVEMASAIQARMQNMATLAETLGAQQASQTNELAALRAAMNEMLAHNQALQQELSEVRTENPALASTIAQSLAAPQAPSPPPTATAIARSLPVAVPPPPTPPPTSGIGPQPPPSHSGPVPDGYQETTVFLAPPGVAEPVEWKLVIPE